MTPLRAKYVRDLAIRGRAERTQETYTSTSVIWRAYHICQLKDEHMLTLARLRTDAACDSLRVADATRYSYKPQKIEDACGKLRLLHPYRSMGKSWDFRLNGKLQIAHTSIDQP
jgi:hypothetical protein